MKKIFYLLSACMAQLCVLAQVPTQDPYPNAVASATQINKYSFFVDSVSTVNEQPLAFATANSNITPSTTISLIGVLQGVHQLYAKVTATNGVASVTNVGNFYMDGNNFYVNAPVAATQINRYSFFVDSLGALNEQPLAFAATSNNVTPSTPISLTGVTSGMHQLYAKVTAINGTPSITNLGNFYMEDNGNFYANAPVAATQINTYSFFIDSVSTSNEQPLAFATTNSNSTPSTPISLTGVTSGVHQLYAKVTATNGVASVTNVGNFYMDGNNFYVNAPVAAAQINTYSFFIDSVSTSNEQPLAFATTNSNITPSTPISLTGVTLGVHQLYAKVTATNGTPSINNIGNFFVADNGTAYPNVPTAAIPINRYEFFIDSVSNTNIQPLTFTAAVQNSTSNTSINLTAVLPGIHNLYARVFDVNNVQSIINVGQFAMEQNFRYRNVASPAPPLQNMEYYIDTDPGYSLATPISISGTNTTEILNNITIAIPTNLIGGTHFLHLRSKQNPWSIDNALPFNISTVVPVTWLYIKAELQGKATQIQWATATEINSKHFEVEWSVDGAAFTKIGSQNAAGNTNNTSTYNYTHANPSNGFNYYRLKQVDADGRYMYSAIVKVFMQKNNNINIYPNPATTYIQLELASTKNNLVQILDAQGKQVIQQYSSNQPLLKIDITTLAKGNYLVQVSDGKIAQTGSFLKL